MGIIVDTAVVDKDAPVMGYVPLWWQCYRTIGDMVDDRE